MVNLILVPIVIAIVAIVLTALVGGFRSFTNLAFVVPVLIVGLMILAYGHPHDFLENKAAFDYDRLSVGIIVGIAGMIIGCLFRHGLSLIRKDEPAVLPYRPGDRLGCRTIISRPPSY